ncbi:MAG: hypothetical protein ACRD21_19265 [Vicinamibacteria bacterium]
MKTVTSTLTLATLAFAASVAISAPKIPSARLLDIYSVKEGDTYVVHVLASGDISQFLSDRKNGEGTYRLTLDVPAVSPMSSKFDVETPFSRQIQVWPMQLGKKIYSRIEIEIELEASSVVGLENASHLFVRIRKELPPGVVVAETTGPTSAPEEPAREEPSPVLSARLGAESFGTYDTVEFLDISTDFFDYRTRAFGGTFLYGLSPLMSLLGK